VDNLEKPMDTVLRYCVLWKNWHVYACENISVSLGHVLNLVATVTTSELVTAVTICELVLWAPQNSCYSDKTEPVTTEAGRDRQGKLVSIARRAPGRCGDAELGTGRGCCANAVRSHYGAVHCR